jgi:hypothetical protein
MKAIRYLNVILTVLAVLLVLQLWTTWTSTDALVASARAAAPAAPGAALDAGAQRAEIIGLLKQLTQGVQDQTEYLKSGQLRVQAVAADKDKTQK